MSQPITIEDLDGNIWDVATLKAVPDNNPKNFFGRYLNWKKSDLDEIELVNDETIKSYKRIPTLFNMWTDGESIYKQEHLWKYVRYYKKDSDDFVTSDCVPSGKRFWKHLDWFTTKERIYNGKPTLYWVSTTGIMIPTAVITATAFLGPKPAGHTLQFVDGDYQNCKPENLRWTLKTKPDGSVRYVSYDKSKKKFRVTHPTLPRKCFKSQEEAVNYLKSQQVAIQYVNNEDAISVDPVIVRPEIDSDTSDEEAEPATNQETIHL